MRKPTHPAGPEGDDISWQDYEVLVKDIYQALGRAKGVTIECQGSKCRVRGRSGVSHQIDVLTKHTDGLHEYRTAISCRYRKKKVGKPAVMEFANVIDDANLSKGVMVSKAGFTGPAQVYAQHVGIGLVELRKPVDADWDGYIQEVRIQLVLETIRIDDLHLRLRKPEPLSDDAHDLQGRSRSWSLPTNGVYFEYPDNRSITLQQLAEEEHKKQPNQERYDVEFPEGSVVTVPASPEHAIHGHPISSASFKARPAQLQQELAVRADDHVYMIMESLFDGRRFTITNSGEIVENESWSDDDCE